MIFRYGEFFCGAGGLSKAAIDSCVESGNETYRIAHQWAVDNNEDACITYAHNICPGDSESVINDDVRKVCQNLANLPAIDAFAFGFPCNDFSVVGECKGFNGDYGPLYSYGVQVIETFKPKWFVAENVSGLQSSNEGRAFKQIIRDLVNAGYQVTAHLYCFEDYGVPQTRHRIIMVGTRDDLQLVFQVPKPFGVLKTCRSAIEDPPIPTDASNQELTRQSPTVIQRLMHIKPGQNAWTADLPTHLQLNVKKVRLSHIYRRLDADKPAYTITGSGGGGTHVYHWSEPRALTNRERARLQTFPDSYTFLGSKESVRKQIGMAVPVEGARVIFQSILKTFAGINYDCVQPNIGFFTPADMDDIHLDLTLPGQSLSRLR